ncbi:uncharacterized protein LOC113791179 [Dermatophagoides pteronyssinus]|uniref:uncharacterized protein LOC113791179 n=1 Tax=Dermatophagoides pteronyssinus TaxID=6956 RepID=UPI003F681C62
MQKEGKKQLLNIDPKNEISFKGPYDHVVTEYFTLTNPTDSIIAFKVKTTAPKKYCVRPNNGIISSNRTVQVAVMLQPGDLTQEKHKHKFMIQSVIVPNNIDVNQIQFTVDELFKQASPDEIMDSKFKCVFLDLTTPSTVSSTTTTTTTANIGGGGKNVSAQNFDHDNISDIVGSSGDDLVNGVSNSNYPTGNDSCTSSCSEHNDNNNHHHLHQNNGDFVSTGSTTLEYQHFVDDHMMIGRNNKKLESTVIPSSINKQQQNNKNSENVAATSILSTMENVSSIPSNNSSKDAETKLKLAEEEIRALRDKLQQVQQYASKFSSHSTTTSSSLSSKNGNKSNESLLDNNQLLIKISVIVVIVSFIIGTIIGKMF